MPGGKSGQKGNKMRTTKVYAKEVLNIWRQKSQFSNGSITEGQADALLSIAGLNLADRTVIIMALIAAGVKFAN